MAIGGISWPRKPDPCSLRQDWGGRSTDLDATSLRGNEVRHVTRQRPHPLPLRGGALATSRGRGEAAAPLRGTQNASWGGVCRSPSLQGGGASEKGVPALKRGGPAGGGGLISDLDCPLLPGARVWEGLGSPGERRCKWCRPSGPGLSSARGSTRRLETAEVRKSPFQHLIAHKTVQFSPKNQLPLVGVAQRLGTPARFGERVG